MKCSCKEPDFKEIGPRSEYHQQVNSYALLRKLNGFETTALKICFILRDFNLRETVQEGYPKAGVQMQEVPLWPFRQTQLWIEDRVELHLKAEQQNDEELLQECSPEEMWEKPESWAVSREGSARATKLYKSEELGKEIAHEAANADRDSRNGSLKKNDKPFFVEHRPGERIRCHLYCDARGYCNSWREYSGAAFGKLKPEEI